MATHINLLIFTFFAIAFIASGSGVDETLHCFYGICAGKTGPCTQFCTGKGYPRGGNCLLNTGLCCCIGEV
ncbi:LCR-like protein [Medicago truncatula]|uniref:LCR-like protein n=1 Tax=Medicago truncatula TaxID=3880 RepID=G7IT39_MEDTR|nr:LCR-like protein [Medicago truncatula]